MNGNSVILCDCNFTARSSLTESFQNFIAGFLVAATNVPEPFQKMKLCWIWMVLESQHLREVTSEPQPCQVSNDAEPWLALFPLLELHPSLSSPLHLPGDPPTHLSKPSWASPFWGHLACNTSRTHHFRCLISTHPLQASIAGCLILHIFQTQHYLVTFIMSPASWLAFIGPEPTTLPDKENAFKLVEWPLKAESCQCC